MNSFLNERIYFLFNDSVEKCVISAKSEFISKAQILCEIFLRRIIDLITDLRDESRNCSVSVLFGGQLCG